MDAWIRSKRGLWQLRTRGSAWISAGRCVQGPERRDPAHALRPLLQLPKHRVAENVMHVAGIVRRVAPTLEVPWRRDRYQFFRPFHRQRIQQNLVEKGKDRGICADPECYRKHRSEEHTSE